MYFLSDNFFENKFKVSIALLTVPVLLLFRTIYFDYTTMDEQWMIIKNASFLESIESLKMAFTTPLAGLYYRPMLLITIILDFQIGKLSPYIYHLTNLLWHLLSILLLYRTLNIFGAEKRIAFVLSVLFSIHPIVLHAVAWIPGRNDLILSVFILLSLINLKKYIDDKKNKYKILHVLFFILAMATKESAIVLPLVYAAIWITYSKEKIRAIYSYLGTWLLIAFAWYFLRKSIVDVTPPVSHNFLNNVLNFINGILIYIGKIFIPIQLSVFPTIANSSVLSGFIAIIIISILIFKIGFHDKKIAALGLFIFFILLSIPVWYGATNSTHEHYEHRTYAPIIGLLLFLSQIKFDLNSKMFAYISGIILLLFSFKTYSRMDAYKDQPTFLSYAVRESPDYYLFQMQMGEMHYGNKNLARAVSYFNRAIELRPDKKEIYNNRGGAYLLMGKYKEAINDFTQAMDSNKVECTYYINRCAAYNKVGDINKAMKDLVILLKYCPNDVSPEFRNEISGKYYSSESMRLSLELAEEPNNAELYFKRSQLFLGFGQIEAGMADLKKACELQPDNQTYLNLYLKKSGELRN